MRETVGAYVSRRDTLMAVLAFVMVMVTSSVVADTYYVATNGVDAAGRGSEESPFETIQYAIESATTDSTIYVKPGIYNKGGAENGTDVKHGNRVKLTKKVHLESTDGAAVTHIVGAPDPDTGGVGSKAVRCVLSPDADSAGSTIVGFTLRDGYGSDSQRAGGFLQMYGRRYVYFSDCVISNCAAYTHGGARGGTFARCLFANNRATTSPAQEAPVIGSANLVNCVVVGNGDRTYEYVVSQSWLVNCTVICNRGRGCTASTLYNSVVCGNAFMDCDRCTTYNCAVGGVPVYSPLDRDYRVVAGSAADMAGEPSYLSDLSGCLDDTANVSYMFSDMVQKDFAGNSVNTAASHVHAGAVQNATTVEGGLIQLVGPLSCNGTGLPNLMPTYAQSTNCLTQWRIIYDANVVSGTTTNYLRDVRRTSGASANAQICFPDSNDSFVMMVPPKTGLAVTNTPEYCKALWVNPAGSDTVNNGSESSPYATIQKALDIGGGETVVFLAPGIHNSGGVSSGTKGSSRLWISSSYVRIVGKSGADSTFIVGASDSGTGGFGEGAVRCVGGGANYMAISGVTLSNGWTQAETGDKGRGAAVYGSVTLTDSKVTCCHGHESAFYSTYLYRCKVYGNEADTDSLFQSSGQVTCSWIGPNKAHSSGYYGYIGSGGQAWFTTLIMEEGRSLFSQNAKIYNCLAVGGRYVRSAMTSKGNLFWGFAEVDAAAVGTFVDDKPYLTADKLHVKSKSSALTSGVAPSEAGYDASDVISRNWYNYCSADVEGNFLRFNTDGTVMSGASHDPIVYVPLGFRLSVR